jgi:murein L,D-transpeptidase YafK
VRRVVRWMGVVGALLALACGAPRAAAEMIAAVSPDSAASAGYPVIEIWKSERKMELRQGDAVIGRFRIVLGQQPRLGKERQGDGRTPVGRYYVSDKKSDTAFHRFLGISYPNVDDAERAYQRRLLDADQWADIFFANLRGDPPPSSTILGGRVGIHGYGFRPYLPIDWTEGCVAVSNDDIELIYDRVPVGTPVIINE